MYAIFPYIHDKNQPNAGKYTIPMDGAGKQCFCSSRFTCFDRVEVTIAVVEEILLIALATSVQMSGPKFTG